MPDLLTIPGLPQLWAHTLGDPRIAIAVLDGPVDMARACFQGANFRQLLPYWQPEPKLIDLADIEQYWKLEALQKEFSDIKRDEDQTAGKNAKIQAVEAGIDALRETIPEPIRNRLHFAFHATHIASTILGQHGSPVSGVAPNCTGINIPIDISGEGGEFISPLNIARAFNLAMEQGANIIHCAACHPTQTGLAHELIVRAVKQCQDNGILIVAPGGNDKGECWCVPAVLPNVLTVGALRDDGIPFKFSNWGGRYQEQGIMTFGENILGAQPGTDEPARKKGTSCAAPIITGLAALFMSWQLQRGEKPNAEAIRQAILNSAIPCDPREVEEPERCLMGKLNIPGAFNLLTGENLLASQPTSTKSSQYFQQVRDYYNTANSVIVRDVGTTYQAGLVATDSDNPFRATNLFVAERAGIEPGHYLLDAGCGAGGPAIDIAQNIEGVKIEAITISESQAQTARQLVQQAGLSDRIRVHVGDYHQLPFDDNVFDIAYFLESIAYADDPRRLCIEIYRVLRPGQILYIKDLFIKEPPLSEQEQHELAIFQKIYAYKTPLVSQFQEAVQLAGFQEIEVADLSGIVNTNKFVEKMFKSSDELSEFGKSHYYSFKTAPVYFAEIKARKPAAPAITISFTSSSHKDSPAIPNLSTSLTSSQSTDGIAPSATSNLVYGLGTIGYDFGSEARRDSFKQLMPAVAIDGTLVPANPYDARQMVNYLSQNPSEAKALIWTLNQELTPIYALEPRQGFSADVYETLIMMLAGQIEPEDSNDFVERVSIPAKTAEKTVQLFSGQEVPVITIINTRGMYGWKVNSLVDAALGTVSSQQPQADEIAMRKSLTSFLNRVYYDFQNLGQFSKDRALNFSVTNAFQAASSFSEAVSRGMHLDTIEVEKSPFCRINSDCWDVILKFFDPDNSRRAKKVYRFTVDVSDRIPVTLGEIRSWSVPK